MSAPVDIVAMACEDASCDFKPMKMQRRPVGEYDVLIDMKYCGVCHSDLSTASGHISGVRKTNYPCVPGHELAGIVSAVGGGVTKVKVGEKVGVGCMVDSCRKCYMCKRGEEHQCLKTPTETYNSKDNGSGRAATYPAGGYSLGGYTSKMVVHEHFAIPIPESYPLEHAGPVMCAGITMYAPLKKFNVKEGSRVGIIGLGGLGGMGIKLAKAMGAEVTGISRSDKKEAIAREMGCTHFVVSSLKAAMKEHAKTLDLIINTVPSYHPYTSYNVLLKKGGKQVLLGLHQGLAAAVVVDMLTFKKSKLTGSGIGNVAETQEVIELCDKFNIFPNTEVVPCSELNSVYEALEQNNDSSLRYVLDLENTLSEDVEQSQGPPALSEQDTKLSIFNVVKETAWLFFSFKWL